MNLYGKFSFTHLSPAVLALLVPLFSAHAQVNKAEATKRTFASLRRPC